MVGLGASAGGLEAFTQLLSLLPDDSGMAFVVVQDLDASHGRLLGEALARCSSMVVREAEDGMEVRPNQVYVIPPDACLGIRQGRLEVSPRHDEGPRLPIDGFLQALAEERGSLAIGVILSGNASDGTAGLAAIRAAEGITFAEDPRSATFGGMPHSAVDSGVVDRVLPLPGLARELIRLSQHPYVTAREPPDGAAAERHPGVTATVLDAFGVDFSQYSQPTVVRRLARRMAVRGITDLGAYRGLLEANPAEIRNLYEDMFAHVTSFFRDPDVFETLKTLAFPAIFDAKQDGGTIRVWVPGCSTGEEVYSLAMALLELAGERGRPGSIQLFASDVSEKAIAVARAGVYSDGALATVGAERRRRFFTRTDHGNRINKNVRDMCIFARHDLAKDPPLAKMDLVSCRNVLVHFSPASQQRILPRFHYALNEPGFLLLGSADGMPRPSPLFAPVDGAVGLLARSALPSTLHFAAQAEAAPGRGTDVARQLDQVLLSRYAPSGVLIDEDMEILSFRGETSAYLRAAPGKPQNDLFVMARPELRAALRRAIAKARTSQAAASQAVELAIGGVTTSRDVVVIPCKRSHAAARQRYVVLFEQAAAPARTRPRPRSVPRASEQELARLEEELDATKDYLRSLNEQHERMNEELASANDELSSGNEELQTTNQDLESAKQELQSMNEELRTVNDELCSRNVEVNQVNGDLVNLIGTVDFPILFLDRARCIRRFTPRARSILAVVPGDVGRHIQDLKLNIDVPDLDGQIAEVIDTMALKEAEVQDRAGRWFRMQIRPYRTTDGRIDGAILSLVDIDELKHVIADAYQARAEAERANRAKDQFLATLSHELRTPLATVLMQAQMLQGKEFDGAKLKQAGRAIERGARQQVRLIDDLLDISRIVAGKLTIERELVDLAAIAGAALESVAAPAAAKAIRLTAALAEDVGLMSGDPARLQQVVMNLLVNAIKFSAPGADVSLTLTRVAGRARLTVQDSGQGIDPAFLPHIWSRFSQEDTSLTRKLGGLGLGLAIVRHLVENHGGTVSAESAGKGQGATFTIDLPLRGAGSSLPVAGAARGSPAPIDGPIAAGDLRVLVVDDDAGSAEVIADVLRRIGASVWVVQSALEALPALAALKPSVVVCDIAMPEQDGYTFIAKVRELGPDRGGDVPAVALTALAAGADAERAIAAGFQLHMSKPIDVERLKAAVMALARQARPAPMDGRRSP